MLNKKVRDYVFKTLICLLLFSSNSFVLADVIDIRSTWYEYEITPEWYTIYFGLFALFFIITISLIIILRKKLTKDVNNQDD